MKGWWVRYKFCIWRVDGVQGRARTAVVNWGFLLASAAPTCPSYLRRLLKGLSRPHFATVESVQIDRAKP